MKYDSRLAGWCVWMIENKLSWVLWVLLVLFWPFLTLYYITKDVILLVIKDLGWSYSELVEAYREIQIVKSQQK